MKKQTIYIFIALFVLLAFLFMLVNTTPYTSGYSSYMNLANSAGIYEGATSKEDDEEENMALYEGAKPNEDEEEEGMTTREGLHMAPVENQFQTIVPYLDDARGPQCARTSNGITATGGPLCLTQDQQHAMASRGRNSDLNHCKPYHM